MNLFTKHTFIISLLLASLVANAGETILTQFVSGSKLGNTTKIRVVDPVRRSKYDQTNYSTRVNLVYGREDKTDVSTSNWSLIVDYKLTFFDESFKQVGTSITGERLSISFNSTNPVYLASKTFATVASNYPNAFLEVTSVSSTGSVPSDVRLELSLVNTYDFNLAPKTPTLTYRSADSTLYWPYIKGANEYQIEWVFLDDQDSKIGVSTNADAFLYKEPVRIQTSNQYFNKFNFTYPDGKIYIRMRGVGVFLSNTENTSDRYTSWYYISAPITSKAKELNKNWQYVTTYAEEGKSKKVISYMDGTLRSRQTLTSLSSENVVIAGETKYDYEGRAVLSMMPAALANTSLGFVPNLNRFATSDEKAQYDKDLTSSTVLPALSEANSASANYYSAGNNVEIAPFRDFLPRGNGYTYAITQYMEDGTNRPMAVSGVGQKFRLQDPQLADGHYTKFHYANANATELRRLFGSNVGEASHYRKNYTTDANGQKSIAYLDQVGRVVATCLAGVSPSNLNPLESNTKNTLTLSLKENNVVDKPNHKSTSTSVIHNLVSNTKYYFKYNLNGVINQANSWVNVCKDCAYDLSVKIVDPNGNEIVGSPFTASNIKPTNYDCTMDDYSKVNVLSMDPVFALEGDYTITKTLTLNSGAIDLFKASLETQPGYPSKSTILAQYMANIDYSKCDVTCEDHCRSEVARQKKANPSMTQAQLDQAYTDCIQNNCTNLIDDILEKTKGFECESILEQMKQQVSPGGIYNNTTWITTAKYSAVPVADWGVPAPASINDLLNASLFEEKWAKVMVERFPHPEYCHYSRCISNVNLNSNKFDKKLGLVSTWTQARNLEYVDYKPNGTLNTPVSQDPYFSSNTSLATTMNSKLSAYKSEPALNIDMNANGNKLDILSLHDFVSGPFPYFKGNSYVPSDKEKWNLYLALYIGAKKEIQRQAIMATCPYVTTADAVVQDPAMPQTETDVNNANSQNMQAIYAAGCPENVKVWMGLISFKCEAFRRSSSPSFITDSLNIANDLQLLCSSGCGYNNPFGLLYLDQMAGRSSEQILSQYGGCRIQDMAFQDPYKSVCYNSTDNLCGSSTFPSGSSGMAMPKPQQCISSGFKECPADLNTQSSCSDPTMAITPCAQTLIDGIARLVASNCNNTAVSGCPSSNYEPNETYKLSTKVQTLINTQSSCYSSIRGSFLNSAQPVYLFIGGDFIPEGATGWQNNFYFKSNFPRNGSDAPYCEVPEKYNGVGFNFNSMNVRFYTYVAGVKTYIPIANIVSVGSTQIDCAELASVDGMNVNHPAAVKVGLTVDNFAGINYPTSVVASIEVLPSDPSIAYYDMGLQWKIQQTPIIPANTLCNTTYTLNWTDLRNDCEDNLEDVASFNAQEKWEDAVEEYTHNAVQEHMNKCFESPLDEDFYVQYETNEYHYTLYYYDQAGNLVQTVPPAGVNPLPTSAFTSTGSWISGNEPQHHLITKYKYNALNQLTWQSSPDGGESYFFYNSKMQLRLSQNAKQKAASTTVNNQYAYSVYDALGRVVESGQLEKAFDKDLVFMTSPANKKSVLSILDNGSFPEAATYELKQIVRSTYDVSADASQKNLRGRVASAVSKADETTEDVVTSYSYDAHGNVNTLKQNITGFGVKQIEYEYDLISGKTNKVSYQKGQSDQFIHKYEYDSDNRIRGVYTSSDGVNWEEDARYFYYKHGPIARVELGEDKVQGLDHYYTLQGWLKGVNIPNARKLIDNRYQVSSDIGKDGNLYSSYSLNKYVGQDEYAYALGYYNGDYSPISSIGNLGGAIMSNWNASSLNANVLNEGLYNGNIAWMATQVHQMGYRATGYQTRTAAQSETYGLRAYAYQYDQLNRLTHAFNYGEFDGDWKRTATINNAAYDAKYTYDPNGNILTAKVNGPTNALMDDLNYAYQPEYPSTFLANNRLFDVVDNAGDQGYGDLKGTQATPFNYSYDAIGNLIKDKSEDNIITWNVNGKVASVTHQNPYRERLYFTYDAMGRRVKKSVVVTTISGVTTTTNTHYVMDASGNVMATYTSTNNDAPSVEHIIYGSERLGSRKMFVMANGSYRRLAVNKQYELKNHLGNVLATVLAFKTGIDTNTPTDATANYYTAQVLSGTDYYPFGWNQPERSFGVGEYRYGFNGQEKDNEINGTYTAEFWQYDPRTARRWNVDPVFVESISNYSCFNNNPIYYSDINGDSPSGGDKELTIAQKRVAAIQAQQKARLKNDNKNSVTESERKRVEAHRAARPPLKKNPQFYMKLSTEVSVGEQIGIEAHAGAVSLAAGINNGSSVIVSGSMDNRLIDKTRVTTGEFYYIGQNNKYIDTYGGELELLFAGGGVKKTEVYEKTGDQTLTLCGESREVVTTVPFAENTISTDLVTGETNSSSAFVIGAKVAAIFGLEVKFEAGFTTSEQQGTIIYKDGGIQNSTTTK